MSEIETSEFAEPVGCKATATPPPQPLNDSYDTELEGANDYVNPETGRVIDYK